MKKILCLCATCMMLFACGTNQNYGVELSKKYIDALENGDYEKAEVYLELLKEWKESHSQDEIVDAYSAIEDWYSEKGEEISEAVDVFEEWITDSTTVSAIEEVASDLCDTISEYASEVSEYASENYDQILENYGDQLENAAETYEQDVREAVEQASEILESLF